MPQIEVAFDIDANGIVQRFSKRSWNGKSQSIKITSSSGLSEEEIQKMVRDAEVNADADKKRAESIQAKNTLDQLVYQTEKTVKDLGDKVDGGLKAEIDSALAKARDASSKESLEDIKSAMGTLEAANTKLAEKVYAQTAQQQTQNGRRADWRRSRWWRILQATALVEAEEPLMARKKTTMVLSTPISRKVSF